MSNNMNYTYDQSKKIYQDAQNRGLNPDKVMAELVKRGATFEGVDMTKAREFASNYQEPQIETRGGLKTVQKVQDVIGGKEISQALGQGMANKQIAQQITAGQNQAIDIQGKLIKNIKEMKALGQDTSRLEDALQEITGNISAQGKQAGQLLNQEGITGKQIAGDVLQLGTTIAGAGTLPGVAKGVTTAQTVGQGIAQGAKAGAMTGAGFGGTTGVSQGLQEDKTAGEIVKQGLGGAVGGAVTGGILGGVVGGVSGGIKNYQTKKANQDFIDEMITPEVEKGKIGLQALKTGKVKEGTGVFGSRDYKEALPQFNEIKKSVASVPGISSKNTNLQNLNAIHGEIGNTADKLVTSIKGKGFFSPNEFNSYMSNVKKSLGENPSIVGDAQKTADKILDKFNSLVKKNGYTPEGLLNARKQLDQWMGSQKGNIFNPNTENAMSIALRAIRQGGNNFLESRVQDVAVRDMLSHQSKLYQAIDLIAPKAQKEGATLASRVIGAIRSHPVGAVASGIAGGTILSKVIGE